MIRVFNNFALLAAPPSTNNQEQQPAPHKGEDFRRVRSLEREKEYDELRGQQTVMYADGSHTQPILMDDEAYDDDDFPDDEDYWNRAIEENWENTNNDGVVKNKKIRKPIIQMEVKDIKKQRKPFLQPIIQIAPPKRGKKDKNRYLKPIIQVEDRSRSDTRRSDRTRSDRGRGYLRPIVQGNHVLPTQPTQPTLQFQKPTRWTHISFGDNRVSYGQKDVEELGGEERVEYEYIPGTCLLSS